MRHLTCLLPLAILLIGGCAESTTDMAQTVTTSDSTFDYIADADFDGVLTDNPVVVVNFTADW